MALIIRDNYRLPTVRISLRPSRSGNHVQFQCYHGSEELLARDVPAGEVGIQEDLHVQAYRDAEFKIPAELLDTIAGSLRPRQRRGEPIWMIVESSGYLAVVPWERLLQPALKAPLLRIPNFLADPMMLCGSLRLAVCLSSPIAKTPFDIPSYACALVEAIRKGVPQGTRLHVFSDAQVYQRLRSALPGGSATHSIEIHDPQGAERFGIGDVDRRLSDAAPHLKSPWLLWMHSELPEGVDAAHFVCPGYFRRDRGALALARSPLRNIDPDWSHFVGAQELMAFLQMVGAWSVMFSPPYENVWSIGLRVVAGSLAWQRPGPVLLHDIHDPGDFGEVELEQAYRFLFAESEAPPPATPGIMLYVHPKRVPQYEDMTGFWSAAKVRPPKETARDAQSLFPRPGRRNPSAVRPAQPPWRQVAQVQMDQVMLRLKDSDTATGQGITDALWQLSKILDQGDS